jgi:hypothetical protein
MSVDGSGALILLVQLIYKLIQCKRDLRFLN